MLPDTPKLNTTNDRLQFISTILSLKENDTDKNNSKFYDEIIQIVKDGYETQFKRISAILHALEYKNILSEYNTNRIVLILDMFWKIDLTLKDFNIELPERKVKLYVSNHQNVSRHDDYVYHLLSNGTFPDLKITVVCDEFGFLHHYEEYEKVFWEWCNLGLRTVNVGDPKVADFAKEFLV